MTSISEPSGPRPRAPVGHPVPAIDPALTEREGARPESWLVLHAGGSDPTVAMGAYYELSRHGVAVEISDIHTVAAGDDLSRYAMLVLVLPAGATSGAKVLEQVSRFGSKMTAYRQARRGAGVGIGVVLVVGSQAVTKHPVIGKLLPGVDGRFTPEQIHLIMSGAQPSVAGSGSIVDRAAMGARRGGPSSVSASDAQQELLLEKAWLVVTSSGLTTVGECRTFLGIVERMRTTYFEDPRRSAFYRPLGNSIEMNALDIICSGLTDYTFEATRQNTNGNFARGLRRLFDEIRVAVPGFQLAAYHTQEAFRDLYQATILIVDTQAAPSEA